MSEKQRIASKKWLQLWLGTLSMAPLLSGVLGLRGIYNLLFPSIQAAGLLLDSNLRFLNGLSVGLSLGILMILPTIDREKSALRIICAAIFLGGLARLLSIYELGSPGLVLNIVNGVELVCPPVFVYWQHKIAKPAM